MINLVIRELISNLVVFQVDCWFWWRFADAFSDIFGDIFGGAQSSGSYSQRSDLKYNMEISLKIVSEELKKN